MRKTATVTAILGFQTALAFLFPVHAQVTLDGPWSDHMVIQRGEEVSLSGSASPDTAVNVDLTGATQTTRSDDDGRWQVQFPPLSASEPFSLTIEAEGTVQRYDDLLAGDVYLCAGQSNMEFPVSRSMPGPAMPENAQIRLLTVPKSAPTTPLTEWPEDTTWSPAAPETVPDFSAVCWYTAVNLYKEDPTPIGLIDASWGGSQIESWIPADYLRSYPPVQDATQLLDLYNTDRTEAFAQFGERWEEWWETAYGTRPWEEPGDLSGWTEAPQDPIRDWKTYDDPDTAQFYGRVWFRKDVTLTNVEEADSGQISLGLIDDMDSVWVNGHFIGTTFSWSDQRTYTIPPGILQNGTNTILVNISNSYGQGGFIGPAEEMSLVVAEGEEIPLDQNWYYKLTDDVSTDAPSIPWSSVSGTTTLYNGMIAPLGNIALAGAIWYQGESNASRPSEYGFLLEQLIKAFRQQFNQQLPVVIVQLPGYGSLPTDAEATGWALLREAQWQVATDDPLTGLAVTMDAGDRTDIHPPNKTVVASRTAAVMQILQGEKTGATDGITPKLVKRRPNSVTLSMQDMPLTVVGSNRPIALSTCDSNGKCDWVDATVSDENSITVPLPRDRDITEIRYCWGDAPVCNLYSSGEVPVAPFRIKLP